MSFQEESIRMTILRAASCAGRRLLRHPRMNLRKQQGRLRGVWFVHYVTDIHKNFTHCITAYARDLLRKLCVSYMLTLLRIQCMSERVPPDCFAQTLSTRRRVRILLDR
jgi:hypothetical protein